MDYKIQWYEMALFWYEKYNGEEINKESIYNSDQITTTQIDRDIPVKFELINDIEKKWGKVTDMYITIRVLKDNPLFNHLAKGEIININGEKIYYFADLYWNSKDINDGEYITETDYMDIERAIKETEEKYWNVTEICLHFWIRYYDPLFDFFKRGENITFNI